MIRILFFVGVLSIFSCSKNNSKEEVISGVLLHTISRQPLANQQINIEVAYTRMGPANPPEFPNGQPITTSKTYSTITDNNGKFSVVANVKDDWTFFVTLVSEDYEQKTPSKNTFYYNPNPQELLKKLREVFDTIFAERPAYVRYTIKKTQSAITNDTLLLSTYYTLKWRRTDLFPYRGLEPGYEFNWGITGSEAIGNDQTFIDTIPGESEPQIPVKWLHKTTDTITFRQEFIQLTPRSLSDYIITF